MTTVLVAVTGTGAASAAVDDRAAFVAESRAAGLSAEQAVGLQDKVDAYLTKLAGKATQASPNQIDLGGAVLNVTVPGEKQPRPLGEATTNDVNPYCIGRAQYLFFCAYQYQDFLGDNIDMYRCDYYVIPWYTVGSWENSQTAGTRSRTYFLDGSSWLMRPAHSEQATGVDWAPVLRIRNC
ncbi:hypothetical protein [Streptomyces umbrinus]|uniref:hypothetical protein n=1 Tax=Streptomyces umbrinus TaxID=67370 RepID=UPI003C2E0CD8